MGRGEWGRGGEGETLVTARQRSLPVLRPLAQS